MQTSLGQGWAVSGPHVARRSVSSGPWKHSEKSSYLRFPPT